MYSVRIPSLYVIKNHTCYINSNEISFFILLLHIVLDKDIIKSCYIRIKIRWLIQCATHIYVLLQTSVSTFITSTIFFRKNVTLKNLFSIYKFLVSCAIRRQTWWFECFFFCNRKLVSFTNAILVPKVVQIYYIWLWQFTNVHLRLIHVLYWWHQKRKRPVGTISEFRPLDIEWLAST